MLQKLKNKYIICCELIEMCNLMSIEINYFSNDTKRIIGNLSVEPALSHLSFLKNIDLENINIKTELDDTENERINGLFKMLGSTDAESMLNMINAFKSAAQESKAKYYSYFQSHGKLYIAFGFFGGIVVSIILV